MLIANFFALNQVSGDGFHHVTVDINPAPMNAMVTVSIAGHRFGTGDDNIIEAAAGILEYSVRDNQGQDVKTEFADLSNLNNIGFGSLPIAIAKDNLSHVTMLVMTNDSWTTALMTVLGTDYGESSNP